MRAAVLLPLVLVLGWSGPPVAEVPCSPQGVVVDAAAQRVYVADVTGKRVFFVTMKTGEVRRQVVLPDRPSGLALVPDGSRLFVTAAAPEGHIRVIDTAAGKVTASWPAGHMPCAPSVAPDGATLFYCNRFADSVAFMDTATGKVRARVATVRQPISCAVTPDGKTLFVANHLPAGAAAGEQLAPKALKLPPAAPIRTHSVNSRQKPGCLAAMAFNRSTSAWQEGQPRG